MATGKVHLTANLITGAAMVWLSIRYYPEITVPVIIGSVTGTLITPDMDLEGTTITERMIRDIPIIGKPVGIIWQTMWYPYALLYIHRGYSHSLFWGTPGRIAWLLFIIINVIVYITGLHYILFNENLKFARDVIENYQLFGAYLIVIFVAWYIEDISHYILDYLFSEGKKRGRKKGKYIFYVQKIQFRI